MSTIVRWTLGITIALFVTVVPAVRFRWVYTHAKRLREVTPGILYRSGELTADGFREAVDQLGIRTIVNLQDEWPDPDLAVDYFSGRTVKERDLCRQLGVRYVYIPPDLIPPTQLPDHRPEAIDRFLRLMDDPTNYPVLIHCRAGLHRTGVMTCVYRMEYQNWSRQEALTELKANGFGEYPCNVHNDYIVQYIATYRPHVRNPDAAVAVAPR